MTRAKEALQQELNENKSLTRELANELRDGEDNAKQKDEVYEVFESESNSLRGNCVQRERKQFMEPENLERSERLNSEEDGEINSFINEVPAERIPVDKATTVGAVGVGVDADISKKDNVKSVVEEVNFVENVNVLKTGGYVAKESVKDEAIGDNLSRMQIKGIT